MNLTETITPKSDQINADDLIGGPVTVTITDLRQGTAEQPLSVVTAQFGEVRPYKPSKSMRRVMVTAWGVDGANHVGRQLTLFRNPSIRFGKDEVGGIQISHMSGIDKPLTVALTVTRGKRAPFTVQPLTRDWLAELAATKGDKAKVSALGVDAKNAHAGDDVLTVIRDEYKRLNQAPELVPTTEEAADMNDEEFAQWSAEQHAIAVQEGTA